MLNPATNATQDDFNKFTRMLKKKLLANEKVVVELRDGRYVELEWFVGTGFDEGIEFFACRNGSYLVWQNDGTSMTNDDFDIMSDV